MWSALGPIGLASSGGYRRFAWTREDSVLREWFAGEAAARGLESTGPRPATSWPGGRPDRVPARDRDRLAPGLRARRRRVRRPARRGLGARRGRRAAGRAGSRPAGRSGSAVFVEEEGSRFGAGLPRLAAGDRRADRGPRRAALRDRDGVTAGRRDGAPPGSARVARAGRGDARDGRLLRGAARRAGPRPRRPGRGGRGGQRDLAARALPLRLHRRGQPRRHHPDGGPARPDADLRDDRAGRQQAGPARRAAGDLRPGRRRAQRHQRDPVAGDRLAGRPRGADEAWRRWSARSSGSAPSAPARRHRAGGDRGVGVGRGRTSTAGAGRAARRDRWAATGR